MTPDLYPTLVIDTREQTPLAFTRLPSRPGTLQSGDYSIAGAEELFAVEQKSVPDLVACCCGERERFERELHRLRGFRFARLLIIGSESGVASGRYRSGISPKAVLHTVRAFEVRYIPVIWQHDPAKAAELVEGWAYWFARELVKVADVLRREMPEDEAQPAVEPHAPFTESKKPTENQTIERHKKPNENQTKEPHEKSDGTFKQTRRTGAN